MAIHDLDYFKYTIPTIESYAYKTNSDFIKLETEVINFYDLHYEKFYIIELLKKYERVLHLDADIIVTPHARNIFEEYPDINTVYAYNENDTGAMDRDSFVEDIMLYDLNWRKINGKYIYFNAGVVLISDPYKNIFDNYKEGVAYWDRSKGLASQTLMNYFVVKNKVPFHSISYSFNRMNLGKEDKESIRYKADFIHYAGNDTFGNDSKIETIRNDYNRLYKKV